MEGAFGEIPAPVRPASVQEEKGRLWTLFMIEIFQGDQAAADEDYSTSCETSKFKNFFDSAGSSVMSVIDPSHTLAHSRKCPSARNFPARKSTKH